MVYSQDVYAFIHPSFKYSEITQFYSSKIDMKSEFFTQPIEVLTTFDDSILSSCVYLGCMVLINHHPN